MALKLVYYGQNDSVNCTPDVTLTGDPSTDQATLTAAGYLGGKIMSISKAFNLTAGTTVIVPCDASATAYTGTQYASGALATGTYIEFYANPVPFATLLNGPGEFSGAIGPSGSKKAPVVRALWQGNVNSEGYDTVNTPTFVVGGLLYCGGLAHNNIGQYTITTYKGANSPVVGICTHIPSSSEAWLGVASLL